MKNAVKINGKQNRNFVENSFLVSSEWGEKFDGINLIFDVLGDAGNYGKLLCIGSWYTFLILVY